MSRPGRGHHRAGGASVTAPIRVVLADDHEPIRSGVRETLTDAGFEVCAEAGDAPAAVEAALQERPDVCLLDVHMPGNGIRAAAEITAALPDTAVVMLTVRATTRTSSTRCGPEPPATCSRTSTPSAWPTPFAGVLAGRRPSRARWSHG